jgi:DNA-binding transcriptional MerR regulator
MTASNEAGQTIDELAHEFQLPVSTLRMYQHRGLLPPPERRGRIAYYGDEHVDRLRMLIALQERGFSLAAIKELLDSWHEGRTLDDVIGIGVEGSVWHREEPLVLTLAELAERFPPDALTPDLMRRAAEQGMIRLLEDGRIELPVPRNLDIGTRLMEMGVPATEVIDEYEVLRRACDELATRFTDLYRRRLWPGDTGPEAMTEVQASLAELGPLAEAIVQATLRNALQDAAERFVSEQAEALRVTPRPRKARAGTG